MIKLLYDPLHVSPSTGFVGILMKPVDGETCNGFVGILMLLAKLKNKRKLEKTIQIEKRVRESFRKGDNQLLLYSGTVCT